MIDFSYRLTDRIKLRRLLLYLVLWDERRDNFLRRMSSSLSVVVSQQLPSLVHRLLVPDKTS